MSVASLPSPLPGRHLGGDPPQRRCSLLLSLLQVAPGDKTVNCVAFSALCLSSSSLGAGDMNKIFPQVRAALSWLLTAGVGRKKGCFDTRWAAKVSQSPPCHMVGVRAGEPARECKWPVLGGSQESGAQRQRKPSTLWWRGPRAERPERGAGRVSAKWTAEEKGFRPTEVWEREAVARDGSTGQLQRAGPGVSAEALSHPPILQTP